MRFWKTATGAQLATLMGHMPSVYTIAFGPDGAILASGNRGNPARLWDVVTGAYKRSIGREFSSANSLAFGPNGRRLAIGGGYQIVE
ncbi:MAG: hypothetical protein OXI86_06970, partial [Candidatus Poribacteria bacterium]|nr:hypothetical protein [Candidatus Poribacteria bacterium]